MKAVWALVATIALASSAWASEDLCKTIQKSEGEYQVLRKGNVLNKSNWYNFDVLVGFDVTECLGTVSQTLIKVDGQYLWDFHTTDDSCDGGNTYGVIYSYDLKTPIAHVYDGDLYCKSEGWSKDSLAENYKCTGEAMKLAERKMKSFGLEFEAESSSVELRDPYIYSYVFVQGKIRNRDGKSTRVKVLTNIKSCQFGGVSIDYLEL